MKRKKRENGGSIVILNEASRQPEITRRLYSRLYKDDGSVENE